MSLIPPALQVSREIKLNVPPMQHFVLETVLHCKARLMEMRRKIRIVDKSEVHRLEKCDQQTGKMLFPPPPSQSKEDLKLGDRVKIAFNKRQMKQILESDWNDLIAKNFGDVGTVIGRFIGGNNQTTIWFPKTDSRWVLPEHTLKNVSEDFPDDGSTPLTINGLKIGSNVMMDAETTLILKMQENHGTQGDLLIQVQDILDRIVTFDSKGDAFVTVGEYVCVLVNIALLNPRTPDCPLPPLTPKPLPGFKPGTRVFVTADIEVALRYHTTATWSYKMTKILGCHGVVYYSNINGEIHVKIKDEVWRISRDCLDNEKKQHRRRHKSGDGHFKLTSNFPFAIGDVVQIVNTIQFVRLVKDLHAVEFHKELLKCGTVLGYSSFSLVVVKFGNRTQHVPTNFLHKADQTATQKHKNAVAARNNLKVNDTVMLEHWSGPFLLSLDTKALILRVILSTSKLIGISDDTDEAFVQCDNTVFAVPTTFITAPTSELELYQVIQKLPAQFDEGLESGMLGRIMGIIETCLSEKKNTLKANHESRSLCIKEMGTVNSGEMLIKFATSTNMMSDDVKEISARLSEIQRHEFNLTASGTILQVKVKLSDYDHTGKESEQSTPSQIIPGVTLQLPVQSEVTDRPQENFLNRAMDTLDTESDKISGFESETDREEFVDDEAEYLSGGPSLAGEEADDDVINVDSSEDVTGIFQANERSDVESVQHEFDDDNNESTEHTAQDNFETIPKQPVNALHSDNPETIQQHVQFFRDTKEIILKCSLDPAPVATPFGVPVQTGLNRQNSNLPTGDQVSQMEPVAGGREVINISGGRFDNCHFGGETFQILNNVPAP